MDIKLELVPVPVSDVDRSLAFYTEKLGFALDVTPSEGVRFVQLTPPGSACSVVIGTGLDETYDMAPGAIQGLHLVVNDIAETRNVLGRRGVEVGDLLPVGGGVTYAKITDPDGNTLVLQQMDWRTGDNF